jgi:hypothetical protein
MTGTRLTSHSISRLFDKMNTFPCTEAIEHGTYSLREVGEYRTDKDLYHVIRLQRIIESIDKISTAPGSDADAQSDYHRVRSELEEFRIYLSYDVSDSRKSRYYNISILLAKPASELLFMQFHIAKLFLYQVAYFERNLQQSPALNLNILCEGLESSKSFLDLYLWLPPKSEMALTNTEWVQLSFGVTQAAKFAIISREPGVEQQTRDLRHRLNIDHVFRHLALRIGALVGRAGEGNKSKDIFSYYEHRVRQIQKWYERMIRATALPPPVAQVASTKRDTKPTNHQRIPPSQSHDLQVNEPAVEPSQVPVSATFSHQQPPGHVQSNPYSQEPLQTPTYQQAPLQPIPYQHDPYQTTTYQPTPQGSSTGSMGLTPVSSYSSYSPVPTIAYSDLMNAHGWGNMFTIPMETDPIFDVSQGYGLGMASPPSEASWDSSSA